MSLSPALAGHLDRLSDPVPPLLAKAQELADDLAVRLAAAEVTVGEDEPSGYLEYLAGELAETITELARLHSTA